MAINKKTTNLPEKVKGEKSFSKNNKRLTKNIKPKE